MAGGSLHRLAEAIGSAAPELLEAFVESIADGVYVIDHRGDVAFANRAALELLGYAREEELVGRPSHATIHDRRPDGTPFPEDECPLLRPRATGETVRVEEDWFVRRDGTMVPVAYSSAPVATGGGRGAVVVFRDVTERRRAARATERAAADRARAEEARASRARIVAAADEERRRLGRDLHDGAQQRLTNVLIALRLAAEAGEPAELLDHALAETRGAIADLRDFAAGLHPALLTSRGLAAAVASLTARAPLPVALTIPEARFAPAVEAAAYYVIAEALANVAKHARATAASVTVGAGATALTVEVADDGVGGAATGAGLADRVAAAGGTLEVTSPAGAGTRVRATLPLSPPAAA